MYGKESFANKVDFESGELSICGSHGVTYLSDLKDLFKDKQEVNNKLSENPIIYETFYPDIEANGMYIFYGITKILPGRIGKEFFMTRGHIHDPGQMCETYTCLSGQGMLLVQNGKSVKKIFMEPGTIAYIGENSMHRTYNTGEKPFIFMASVRADYEHDYSVLESNGFLDSVTVDDL
jgi:glucose-6-phosphate isomerase, archaeal